VNVGRKRLFRRASSTSPSKASRRGYTHPPRPCCSRQLYSQERGTLSLKRLPTFSGSAPGRRRWGSRLPRFLTNTLRSRKTRELHAGRTPPVLSQSTIPCRDTPSLAPPRCSGHHVVRTSGQKRSSPEDSRAREGARTGPTSNPVDEANPEER